MRDKRFVAEHRGGSLTKEQHIALMIWAHDCVRHVMIVPGINFDKRLDEVLETAMAWTRGEASVGDARKASLNAIALARESSDKTFIAIARATGHVAATAHMADHALRAADYALKAVACLNGAVEEERLWQEKCLPEGVRKMVISMREIR